MKISIFWVFLLSLLSFSSNAQNPVVNGRIVDAITYVPLPQVKVAIEDSFLEVFTEADGTFSISLENTGISEVVLIISRTGYVNKRLALKITNSEKNLEEITLQPDEFFERSQQYTISLSDAEILAEDSELDNISGILQSAKDVFLSAAAFDFSQTFFRVRGLGAEYGELLINGTEMNKFYDGKPQWNNWGGLNDVQRNQIFTNGIAPADYAFGSLGGTTNILMRASKYQKGARFSVAGSNRSYTGRLMATYASGEQANGWFYAFSIGKRYAENGYIEGTLYDSNSFFASVEKNLNDEHAINFSAIYSPTLRGKSAPLTQEVFDLKGRKYNPYWGFQEGEVRNSRTREIKEPILMLNHYWQISDEIELNTNLTYQFGETANSRIDYGGTSSVYLDEQEVFLGGGENPDPSYYQKLPSYFLRFEENQNFEAAYRAQDDLVQNGQLNWDQLYLANQNSAENAIYALAEDVNKDNLLSANMILDWDFSENLKLNSKISYSGLRSHNFARIKDLFGAEKFLDIDVFADETNEDQLISTAQSDLLNPNRLVSEGETYKYDYDLSASRLESFLQVQYYLKNFELSLAVKAATVSYQRTGNYQNGIFPAFSLGEGTKTDFIEIGAKSGIVYKLSGRQNLEFNLGYFENAPSIRNTFVNPRQNHEIVRNIEVENIQTTDLSYRFRSSKFNFRLTGYPSQVNNSSEISYYFANGLAGVGSENSAAFVQEVLSDIDKNYVGLEMGTEYQLTSTLKFKAATAIGQFTYANNPRLYLSSASFDEPVDYGRSYLKDYSLPGGPQRAALIGFEYRDPAYWWFGATLNFFSHAFIDINPLTRTSNFQTDYDGKPLLEYDPVIARRLLKQEQFDDYNLVNVVGGKSWRLKDKYLGCFMSINNLFDKIYKSGGFEQARNSNYSILKEDLDRDMPVFGNKYWFGYGTSFFANVYLRF